jgi:hypothetical protein
MEQASQVITQCPRLLASESARVSALSDLRFTATGGRTQERQASRYKTQSWSTEQAMKRVPRISELKGGRQDSARPGVPERVNNHGIKANDGTIALKAKTPGCCEETTGGFELNGGVVLF